jgi:hypothetical protein
LIAIGHLAIAQQSPVSAGGVATGTNGSASFSIGQLVDDTYSSGSYAVTAGVQQPYEIYNPLPLRFLSFTATLRGDKTLLIWKTAQEQNTNHFEIEKKTQVNNDFSFLASVSTNRAEEYKYNDNSLSEGVTYYRLKEVDNNGLYNYSQIILVNLQSSNAASLKVYPNPLLTQMNIVFNATEYKTYQLVLVDASGRIVISKQVSCFQGSNSINWNVAQLKAGEYILKAVGTDLSPVKIIKSK